MERAARLKKAQHNESFCHYVHNGGQFHDWTVNAAFYAALHYVCYHIFPLTDEYNDDEGNDVFEFKSVEEYKRHYNLKISKHEILSNLVAELIPNIHPDYDQLRDMCQTSRYHNYELGYKKAELAIKLLNKIKAGLSLPAETN
ncbi:MAG: hypothetical protein ACOYVG_02475 [Bacteroidota bacterium]|jgi:hypothetical protein